MSTAKIGSLEIQIEQLVREHIAELRTSAAAAVERAFSQAAVRGAKAGRAGRHVAAPATRAAGQRRPPHEMAALAERLYAVVCAHPGAAMATLASELGTGARELNRPALLLKRAGRVRTVGLRAGTRYFPMVAKSAGHARSQAARRGRIVTDVPGRMRTGAPTLKALCARVVSGVRPSR